MGADEDLALHLLVLVVGHGQPVGVGAAEADRAAGRGRRPRQQAGEVLFLPFLVLVPALIREQLQLRGRCIWVRGRFRRRRGAEQQGCRECRQHGSSLAKAGVRKRGQAIAQENVRFSRASRLTLEQIIVSKPRAHWIRRPRLALGADSNLLISTSSIRPIHELRWICSVCAKRVGTPCLTSGIGEGQSASRGARRENQSCRRIETTSSTPHSPR